jgi:chaperonin GroES
MKLGRDKVLVKRDDAPETMGKFIVPDAAKEKPDYGTVIEVGSEVVDWKKDQRVIFPKWCGFQVTVPSDEEGDYLIIFQDEIWMAL